MKLYETVDSFNYDELIYDTKIPITTKGITLKTGQGILARGTVLGIVTATGQAVTVNTAAADGSQTADCILTDDVDTNVTSPVVHTGYASGRFNRQVLIFGGTDTAANHEKQLRELGIYLKDKM
ncbi:head decoration protein [Domibacillus aminovorans]|uniref:head decoration protein n=1 Tax=Domibacillus aminovorans TaxID=29332 RepID=UPI003D1A79B6